MRPKLSALAIALAVAALAAPAARAMPARDTANAGDSAGGGPPVTYVAGAHRALPEWSGIPRPPAPAEPLGSVATTAGDGAAPWMLIALILAGAAVALALAAAAISLRRRTRRPGVVA
jgi:hypothetical protein